MFVWVDEVTVTATDPLPRVFFKVSIHRPPAGNTVRFRGMCKVAVALF
jgi:hypothetical protein